MRPHSLRLAHLLSAILLVATTSAALAQSRPRLPAHPFFHQAAPLPSADDVMAEAKRKASAENKRILLVFSASWCGPCRMFEGFLDDPATGPIMSKAFVTARLDVGERPTDKRHSNSPGGPELMDTLSGGHAGYPFIVMLDASAKPIVNSLRPDPKSKFGINTGYPSSHAEIDWFMQMLQQAAPTLSPQDTKTIRTWLDAHGDQ